MKASYSRDTCRTKVILQAAESDEDKVLRGPDIDGRPHSRGALQIVDDVWTKEGVTGFFKGLQAQIIKTVLSAALMLMIKEKVAHSTWVVMLAFQRWVLAGEKKLKQVKLPASVVTPVSVAGIALASRATSR